MLKKYQQRNIFLNCRVFFCRKLLVCYRRARVFTAVLYDSIENKTKTTTSDFKSIFKEDLLKLEIKISELKSDMI